jgi:4-diphosphocytidyl-2-C-methyl-D-erythritol kinase
VSGAGARRVGSASSALVPGVHRALAPAKINLGLFLGPTRASDARHELVTVMQSISFADELTLRAAGERAERDELHCPGVEVEPERNLAARALALFREATGWRAPPLRLEVRKRIPVAAGLGGGSADAAATLRLAGHASGLGDPALLRELAFELGADVPAQVHPGRWLATGAGERLQELSPPPRFGVLVLALALPLSTAEVYREADRLGLARGAGELEGLRARLLGQDASGAGWLDAQHGGLLDNDLQRAAVSLCPPIADELGRAREAGAERVLVSGSGPTVLGLFAERERAQAAAARLPGRDPAAVCAVPVDGEFARAVTL